MNVVGLAGTISSEPEFWISSTFSKASFILGVMNAGPKVDDFVTPGFFKVELFGNLVETLSSLEYAQGTLISISGYLKQDRWQDSNGNQDQVKIVATKLFLLSDSTLIELSQEVEKKYIPDPFDI